jgi:hypothetical protein
VNRYLLLAIACAVAATAAYGKKEYNSNGERIYKTGRNLQGEMMLDKHASRITLVKSCQTCHGKHGDAMRRVSIKFSDLGNAANHEVPYTDSLFFRFLDDDLKSDGTKANIGVIWKMGTRDKQDLLDYLKTL